MWGCRESGVKTTGSRAHAKTSLIAESSASADDCPHKITARLIHISAEDVLSCPPTDIGYSSSELYILISQASFGPSYSWHLSADLWPNRM